MNKARIDRWIPVAYEVLSEEGGIAKNGVIDKNYQGQIAAFGAAVSTGSLLSAVSFFSSQGGSKVERNLLMNAIYQIITRDLLEQPLDRRVKFKLYQYVRMMNSQEKEKAVREEVLDAAISLKLAMNLFKNRDPKQDAGSDQAGDAS